MTKDPCQGPRPRDYIAWFAVYLVLAFMAEFGQQPARLAVAIAAVTFLTYAVAKGSAIVAITGKLSRVVSDDGTQPDTGETHYTDLTPLTGLDTNYVTVNGDRVRA